MPFRNLVLSTAAVALGASAFFINDAGAAAVQATITTTEPNNVGTGSGSFALFLNGVPLPVVEQQTISLNVGDILRAEASTSATTDLGTSSFARTVFVDLTLDDGTQAVMLQTTLSGLVDSTPEVAQASAGSEVVCNFLAASCSAPGLPLSTAFTSNIITSTLSIQPNQQTINNVTSVTGNIGGEEGIDLVTLLSVQRAAGLEPTASFSLLSTALAISQASASSSSSLEVTVTTATVVPAPATVWLLGTAVGLLGWRKRARKPAGVRRATCA